jgi:hypothetical protein
VKIGRAETKGEGRGEICSNNKGVGKVRDMRISAMRSCEGLRVAENGPAEPAERERSARLLGKRTTSDSLVKHDVSPKISSW